MVASSHYKLNNYLGRGLTGEAAPLTLSNSS